MKDAQKPTHVSLNTLLGRMREGRFVIPDFQREFEWKTGDVRDLMSSIFRDYYIGSLLLWRGEKSNFDALSCEHLYGFSDLASATPWSHADAIPEHIVLDGQQRLSAMYYAFIAPNIPFPKRANRVYYYVLVDKFMDEEFDDAFRYEWHNRRQFHKVLEDQTVQFERHIFPLSVIGKGGWELGNWVQGYQKYWEERSDEAGRKGDQHEAELADRHAINARAFGEYLKELTDQYQIVYIELDRALGIDKICDIFTHINSHGVQLNIFDLINAMLKPKGLQLKHMWREASEKLDFFHSPKMNVYVLQVMSILLQAYCSPRYLCYLLPNQEKSVRDPSGKFSKKTLVADETVFQDRWSEAVSAMARAINLLKDPREFGVISSQFLPYTSILPVFASLQTICKSLSAERQLDAQRKFRHWYWASVFNNRYSRSAETNAARDFLSVKAWMNDDDAEPAFIQGFKDRFRNLDLRQETKKGTSVYNGVFNLLILQGARDWRTGNAPQHDDLDDHHIIPASWGKKYKNINIHTILNRTPLTADTNRKIIKDRLPNQYFPELFASSDENQVRRILESHFISPIAQDILQREPFGEDDFQEFIEERQRTILEAMESLLIKERLNLSIPLRELDKNIEKTELGIRRIIVDTLGNDAGQLPTHIIPKLEEAVQKVVKKSVSMDIKDVKELNAMLDYADLRQLQDIITSKVTWPGFEPCFADKETFNKKFNQLAELRNGIRHSRSVDEIVKKEGEAAIIWFKQALKL